MELSQTALAMLLVGGFPAGVAINLVYALTDIGVLPNSFAKKLLINVKDFVFSLIAGIVAILLLYYLNNGEIRYLALVGMIGGFAVSHWTLGKLVIYVRNAAAHVIVIPLAWIWSKTFGRMCEKARKTSQNKNTEKRADAILQLASNGFEN